MFQLSKGPAVEPMKCEDFPCCGHPASEGCEDRPEYHAAFYHQNPQLLFEPGSPEWFDAMSDDYPEDDDRVECPHGCGMVDVAEDGQTPGFTGMPIYWANLSCGHQMVDASADNIEAVR